MRIRKKVFISNSSGETKKLGQDFAKSLRAGDVIYLYGDLGSGKTTFVQGLAQGLGIKQKIISPTFIIVRNYRIKNHESRIMNLYHIDLYRVEDGKDLGIEEIINDKLNVVVIEWAEKLKGFLPQKRIDIKFFYEGDNTRKITFGLTR